MTGYKEAMFFFTQPIIMYIQSLPPHQKDGTGGTKTIPLVGLANQQATCKTFIPGDETPTHHAQTDQFVLVLDGQMDIFLGDETSRFAAGDYILIPANTTHKLICIETARLLIFE